MVSKIKQEQDALAYQVYITDALYAIANQNMTIERRYSDLMELYVEQSGDDIAADVIESAGLIVKGI